MTDGEFQLHVVESLARLDTKMASLVGNGQPGRVNKLEDAVEELKSVRWFWHGLTVGVAVILSAIIHFIFKY